LKLLQQQISKGPKQIRNGMFSMLLLLAGMLPATAQTQERPPTSSKADTDQSAVIENLKVYLPRVPEKTTSRSCLSKLESSLCQARIQQEVDLLKANSELAIGQALLGARDFAGARQHCIATIQLLPAKLPWPATVGTDLKPSTQPNSSVKDAQTCIRNSEAGQDIIDKTELESLTRAMQLYVQAGEVDKARARFEELRSKYSQLPPSSKDAREYARQQLMQMPQPTRGGAWAACISWTETKLPVLLTKVTVGVIALFYVVFVLRTFRAFKNVLRRLSWTGKITWNVQAIKDEEKQGAAGAVMDALNMGSNSLLRERFRPPALLLTPPGFSGTEADGIWWDFFGDARSEFSVERIPYDGMRQHVFELDESFEEVTIKVAGQEISGFVSLGRNIRRWLMRGMPAVQGAIVKVTVGSAEPAWAVRLTATSRYSWFGELKSQLARTLGSPTNEQKIAQAKSGSLTISVHSSTQEQEFVDAIGLAAQRSAFKLFYRLANPAADPDEVTAAAAFHQGVVLLRRYL
jgi:hypothetical protein